MTAQQHQQLQLRSFGGGGPEVAGYIKPMEEPSMWDTIGGVRDHVCSHHVYALSLDFLVHRSIRSLVHRSIRSLVHRSIRLVHRSIRLVHTLVHPLVHSCSSLSRTPTYDCTIHASHTSVKVKPHLESV